MLTVSSTAESTALTTLEEVKSQLSVTATDEDSYLESQIARGSAAICTYLNIAPANDGTRTLGRETLDETFRFEPCSYKKYHRSELVLSRYPVTSITSVVEDGFTVDPGEYEDRGGGVIVRLTSEGELRTWTATKIVVTYVAGWLLPGQDGRTLPQDIEDAAIGLIKAVRFNRTRDPLLRSENILESLYSYTLFAPTDKDGIMPADVAALLSPYRNVTI